jgi:hypothetical protein
MRLKKFLAAALATVLLAGILATTALAAVKLTIHGGYTRTLNNARATCDTDSHCTQFGVSNCHRQSLHVVLCRSVNVEDTGVTCTRLVRVAAIPKFRGFVVRITGFGDWSCA